MRERFQALPEIYNDLKKALDDFCDKVAASDIDASTVAENLNKSMGIPIPTGTLIAQRICRQRCLEEASGKRPISPQGGIERRPVAHVGVETR